MSHSLVLAVGVGIGLFIAYVLLSLSTETISNITLSPVYQDCGPIWVPFFDIKQ